MEVQLILFRIWFDYDKHLIESADGNQEVQQITQWLRTRLLLISAYNLQSLLNCSQILTVSLLKMSGTE